MDEADKFVEAVLKASDPSNRYEYEQTQTAHWGNLQPEKKLLMAILEDAFLCIRGRRTAGTTTKRQKSSRDEAMEWVDRDDRGATGFIEVCQHLDFNCQVLRKKAREAYDAGKRPGEYFNRVVK